MLNNLSLATSTANKETVATEEMKVRAGTVIGTGQQPTITTRPNLVKVLIVSNQNDNDTVDNAVLEIGATLGGTYFIEDQLSHFFTISGVLGATGDANISMTLSAEVPNGWFYRIRNVTGNATISWVRERAK